MVSYAGIIREVDIRRKGSFDRFVTRLEFMGAVWRKYEENHPTMLALLYCLHGQMQIVIVQRQNYWCLFRRLGMCYGVICISYKMILPSSTQMDGPRVKCVERTLCSMTVLVRCFLRKSVVPCCSVLPK